MSEVASGSVTGTSGGAKGNSGEGAQKSVGDQVGSKLGRGDLEGTKSKSAPVAGGESGKQEEPSIKEVAKKAAERVAKKYKVYGEEVEVDPDRTDEFIQKGLAFDKKSGELGKLEKKFMAFEDAVKRGDRSAIKKLLGDDRFKQFAVDEINDLIEQEELSPQERAYRERENKLKEREQKIKDEEERKQQEYQKQLDDHYAKKFDEEFSKAVESTGLPKHPRVIGRMAQLMNQNLQMFEDPLPAESIAKLVKKEIEGDVKSLLGALDGQQLSAILGDELGQRIRQHGISQLKNPLTGNKVAGPVDAKVPENKEQKPFNRSMQETRPSKESWRERLDKLKSQG